MNILKILIIILFFDKYTMSIFYKDLNKYRNEYFEKDFLYDIYIAIRILREKDIGNYLNFCMKSLLFILILK